MNVGDVDDIHDVDDVDGADDVDEFDDVVNVDVDMNVDIDVNFDIDVDVIIGDVNVHVDIDVYVYVNIDVNVDGFHSNVAERYKLSVAFFLALPYILSKVQLEMHKEATIFVNHRGFWWKNQDYIQHQNGINADASAAGDAADACAAAFIGTIIFTCSNRGSSESDSRVPAAQASVSILLSSSFFICLSLKTVMFPFVLAADAATRYHYISRISRKIVEQTA